MKDSTGKFCHKSYSIFSVAVSRKTPVNYIMLFFASTFLGAGLGWMSANYELIEVTIQKNNALCCKVAWAPGEVVQNQEGQGQGQKILNKFP